MSTANDQLAALEKCRHDYGNAPRVERLLAKIQIAKLTDAESLVRVHDLLLFLRAFPPSEAVVKATELLLAQISNQVETLRARGADLGLFDDEQFSGVANTSIRDAFTYEVARWLVQRHGANLTAEWNIDEQARQMAVSLPSVMPLIADDCLVEADTPYLRWLSDAAGGESEILGWLMLRLEHSQLDIQHKTSWYDGLRLQLCWNLGDSKASRTLARRNPRRFFFHNEPLITRKQVSLAAEMTSPPLPVTRLARREGEQLLDTVRETLTVRYRELYGTTRGDPASVVEADAGRGVHICLWGLPPERRLPLRAYYAGMTFKNGVPINYIEAIGLFEWLEVGFNTFYAYRDGETALIYSKVLHLLHQVSGATCFSVYPYQLGHENEEAIKSGAFWFYRKLGFRPGRPELQALTEREEARMARNPSHRTSAATLRKLAAHHAFYEFGSNPRGLWDTFSIRNIGFAVQMESARRFGGDPGKMRQRTTEELSRTLALNLNACNTLELAALGDFALVLSLVPELKHWSSTDKRALADIIRAKAGRDEGGYLHRLQAHDRLRQAFLRLGSESKAAAKGAAAR